MNSFADVLAQVLGYARGAWKRRWYGLALAWVICIGGWAIVATLPNKYDVRARVYVDTDTLLAPLLRGLTVETNLTQQVEVMQRTLLARPNLERVIRMADMDLNIKTPDDLNVALANLGKVVSVSSERGARNLFNITYSSSDPRTGLKVVQSLLSIFVETNVGDTRREMEQAQAFINRQIADYEAQLQAAEKRLAEFKQSNIGKLPREGTAAQAVANAEAQLQAAKRARTDAASRLDSLRRQVASTPETVSVDVAPAIMMSSGGATQQSAQEAALSGRLQDLERTLDALTLRFTDKHPDVAETKRQVARVKADLEAERKRASQEAQTRPPEAAARTTRASQPNPVYQQLKLRMSDMEAEAALAELRLAEADEEYKRRLSQATEAADLEAKASNLDRDYGILKKQYDELLQRRESARLAQAKDDRRDSSFQFRIIDPPVMPTTPSGPPRLVFASAALVIGLGVGAGLCILLTLLDDTVATVSRLRRAFSYPVLGAVSKLQTAMDRRRRVMGVVSFGAACAILMLAFGGILLAASRFPLNLKLPGLS